MAEIKTPQALVPNEAIPGFDAISSQAAQDQALTPQTASPTSAYQVNLLQNENNTILPVSQDDADVAIRSGLYSPKKDEEFIVLDKYGNRNRVDGSNLREAMESGLRLETSTERHEREMQEQYGDQEVATAIEGGTRGALAIPSLISKGIAQVPGLEGAEFSADDAMVGISHLGGDDISAEEFQNRAGANPISSMVGNIAGSLAGGTGFGVGKAAAGAEKLIAKTIIKDAARAGLGKKIAATLAAKAVGGAVEGAYYATGDLLSEESLGKADVSAESLASAVGFGALLGGGFGLGVGAIETSIPAVVATGKFVARPFLKQAEHAVDSEMSSARLLGMTPTQFGKLRDRNPGVAKGMKEYLKDDLQLTMTDSADDLLAKNEAVRKAAGENINGVLSEVDSVLAANPELRPNAQNVWNNVYKKVFTQFEDIFSDVSAPGTSGIKRQVTKFLDEIDALSKTGKEFNAADFQRIKRMEDSLLKYEKTPGKWTPVEDMIFATRTAMKEEIDTLAQGLEAKGLSADLADQLRKANRQYSSAATFGDYLENRALKAADKDFSFIRSARDAALDVSRKLSVLGKIERAQQKVTRGIDAAVKNWSAPANKLISAVKDSEKLIPISIMQSEFSKKYEDGKYKKPKDKAEAWSNMHDNFERYGQNPEAFMNRVNRTTSGIYAQAPDTSTALDSLAVRGAMFLANKMPKRTTNPGAFGMFNKPRPPSQMDLSKFERYLNAVQSPEFTLKQFAAGRMSSEAAEAIKIVYPNIFTQLQSKVMQQIGKNPNMPYNKKLQLGLLLDIPTDESLLPENVMALQAQYHQAPNQQAQSGFQPSASSMSNLNIAEREATETQDTELG